MRIQSGESEDGVDTSEQREWETLFRKAYLRIYLMFWGIFVIINYHLSKKQEGCFSLIFKVFVLFMLEVKNCF